MPWTVKGGSSLARRRLSGCIGALEAADADAETPLGASAGGRGELRHHRNTSTRDEHQPELDGKRVAPAHGPSSSPATKNGSISLYSRTFTTGAAGRLP